MCLLLIACSALVFLEYHGATEIIRIFLWVSISILFVTLALLYLCMYRELRNTLDENVFNQLDGERKRMALQFYLFGFCYVCSGVSYAIESWFWSTYTSTHDESNLFIIYVITACLITVGDGLPILYISCVHNSTFRDIQLTKQVYEKQAASCDE